jgi:hypothetical protein
MFALRMQPFSFRLRLFTCVPHLEGDSNMQGTMAMLLTLSGLGCWHKSCDVAYVPSCYSSVACYDAAPVANTYIQSAAVVMDGCYGGGCYGGGCYGGGCYGGGWTGGCYSACYDWGMTGCYDYASSCAPRKRGLFSCLFGGHKRRAWAPAVYDGCYGGGYYGGCYGGPVFGTYTVPTAYGSPIYGGSMQGDVIYGAPMSYPAGQYTAPATSGAATTAPATAAPEAPATAPTTTPPPPAPETTLPPATPPPPATIEPTTTPPAPPAPGTTSPPPGF